MSNIVLSGASKDIAGALIQKIEDAKEGKNLCGAETMCRCVDTLIKLARLEMDYQRMRQQLPAIDFLSDGEVLAEPEHDPDAPDPVSNYATIRGQIEKDLATKRNRNGDDD